MHKRLVALVAMVTSSALSIGSATAAMAEAQELLRIAALPHEQRPSRRRVRGPVNRRRRPNRLHMSKRVRRKHRRAA